MIIPISVSEINDKELIEFVKNRKNYSTFLKNLIYTTMYQENIITRDFFLKKILTDDISNILSKVEINLLNQPINEEFISQTPISQTNENIITPSNTDNNNSQKIIKKSEEGIFKNFISSIEVMQFNNNEGAT